MKWKKISIGFLLAVVLITVSYVYLDKGVALAIKKLWLFNTRLSFFSTDIPDFLPLLVSLITGTAWFVFFYLARKNIYNSHTRFFQLIAITVPLTNVVKTMLKFVFGRINTRFWLQHPGANEFHWLHGSANFSGFPSGHMAVFTVLIIALSIFYPRYQTFYIACLTLLALALIVTNYHFLSDIIAGAYVGLIVHAVTQYFLTFQRGPKNEGMVKAG
ncbi:MAG TPA: phosphatase PAP2 family protein [Nitrospirota bacterium]|nr:phosphatase PAP2 family protein [Nitrospirota bacterium]